MTDADSAIASRSNLQSPFDMIRRVSDAGREYWSARDLMPLLGYGKWENFQSAIERALTTATNSGAPTAISRHQEMVPQGGAPKVDYQLSRFGAYLVAMNGDPRKPEVAGAQAYFAIRTREAETRTPELPTGERLLALAVVEAQQMLAAKDERIAELEPKADLADNYLITT